MKNRPTGNLYVGLVLYIISLFSIHSVASESIAAQTNVDLKIQSKNVSLDDHFLNKTVGFYKKHKGAIITGTILAGATMALASIIKIKFLPLLNQLCNANPLSNCSLNEQDISYYQQIIKEIDPEFHESINKFPKDKLVFKPHRLSIGASVERGDLECRFDNLYTDYTWAFSSLIFELGREFRNLPRDEQKFILAHEIGHVILGHLPINSEEYHMQEFQADEFAVKTIKNVDGGINNLKRIINIIDPGHPTPQDRINALERLRHNTEPYNIDLHRTTAKSAVNYCIKKGRLNPAQVPWLATTQLPSHSEA